MQFVEKSSDIKKEIDIMKKSNIDNMLNDNRIEVILKGNYDNCKYDICEKETGKIIKTYDTWNNAVTFLNTVTDKYKWIIPARNNCK